MSGTYVPSSGPVLAWLSVHLFPGVPVRVRLHPAEDRVVVGIGVSVRPAWLDLFVQRAELVVLRDALADAVTDLDTAQQDVVDSDTNHNETTDDDEGDEGDSAPADEARAPAA